MSVFAKSAARRLWGIRVLFSARIATKKGRNSRKKYTISGNLRGRWEAWISAKHAENSILLIPADQRYNSGLPKSGVVGVTWKKDNKKWQATYKKKYIGLYDTVEQAAKAIQEERERLSQ